MRQGRDIIRDAHANFLRAHPNSFCFGLGVNDPGRIFGTTTGLVEEFGEDRIFEIPTSENALTGVAIGAALAGSPTILSHQRVDFALLSLDQIVNAAAKWHFMFGGQFSVPIVIRMIIGRGWGQGPTHSQSLQSWFAHIPGLKVVLPSIPAKMGQLFEQSASDPNPVIFLEHRWLHNLNEDVVTVPDQNVQIGKALKLRPGDDLTIVSMSYQTLLASQAAAYLSDFGISCEIIDPLTVRPLDYQTILASVCKTGRLLVMDTSHEQFSVASEIVSSVAQNCLTHLKAPPKIIAKPNFHEPTSFGLTKGYYPSIADVIRQCFDIVDRRIDFELPAYLEEPDLHDVPGDWFKGPF